ncbi:MAG: tol-pal system protein YbgF [Candidatus Hydrogenedentes bacterium]|nr:tol-pal system protein YbgF [Candidatus Hydrogenedentota bacterium]
MGRNAWRAASILAILGMALDVGAASNQVETLLYDTHRKVTNLNNSLDGAIKKLNQTTSDLVSRVESSEVQTKRLRSMVEENQVKLDTLTQQLGELTATIYQQFNLTTSSTGFSPVTTTAEQPANSVAIEPPAVNTLDSPVVTQTVGASDPAAAHTVYREAQKVWMSNDYEEALRLFSDFLARYPQSELAGNAHYWQGRCYLKLEQYQEAVGAFEKVRTDYTDNNAKVSQAMQSQAVALSRLGRNAEAEELLREVIEKYPTSSAARQAESDLAKLSGN